MEHQQIPVVGARRHAAGSDPAKRQQIMEGAKSVFSRLGFDAASMSDITREAGVSKGTLYVYFDGKEDLFTSLIEQERESLFVGVNTVFEGPGDTATILRDFALRISTLLCSDEAVRAQRVVIGISERMPELGARFYTGGNRRGVRMLEAFLIAQTDAGVLQIEDTRLAAHQFVELATAGLLRQRLYGDMTHAPDAEMIARTAESAVAMFMARYASAEDAVEFSFPDQPI